MSSKHMENYRCLGGRVLFLWVIKVRGVLRGLAVDGRSNVVFILPWVSAGKSPLDPK